MNHHFYNTCFTFARMTTHPNIKVGIIGGAGYTAGELIRILLHHPHCELTCVVSASQTGKPLADIHTDIVGETTLHFSPTMDETVDIIFLCVEHGLAGKILTQQPSLLDKKIIDLSNEFRVQPHHRFQQHIFQYGLPALYDQTHKHAKYVANPGCFATAIELALLPIAQRGGLAQVDSIHVHAITGSTGAGVALTPTSHFSWRANNVSFYKAFTHQHLDEIKQTIQQVAHHPCPPLYFLPMRGNFTRGILAGVYFSTSHTEQELIQAYRTYYATRDPFVHISTQAIDLKQVINTNKCLLHIQKHEGIVLITATIDNLLKGASGQAVQNMNLMFDLPQTIGLQFKGIAM